MAYSAIAYLRSPVAIRERCQQVLQLAEENRLDHFAYEADKLPEVVTYVIDVIREAYPALDIPFHSRWRHFNVGGVDRLAQLRQCLGALDVAERTRVQFDLVITSVLLDAGAGAAWQYREAETGHIYARSEGLAVASWHMFTQGLFSSHEERPWQADAVGLQGLTEGRLAQALQVTPGNPLVGLSGRAALFRKLGEVVDSTPDYFGTNTPRPGNLADYLQARARQGRLVASQVLSVVLDSLGPIWPGRLALEGVNLGDVWYHRQVAGKGLTAGLVPFHKLSQWLTYSLIEPLQAAGLTITGSNELTALAEYRNGGLLLDLGLLRPKHDAVLGEEHAPDSEVVVEWRALTVALLDVLADRIRQRLGVAAEALPLIKILQGGTWRAGRKIAQDLRADGSPPIRIVSDGTVF